MLLLGLMAGCAAPVRTPQPFCSVQAERDPAVKALIVQSVSGTAFHGWSDLAAARDAARRDCLRRQGVLPPGDRVEAPAVQRRDTLFGW